VPSELRESSEHRGISEREEEERWSAENAGGEKKRTPSVSQPFGCQVRRKGE
jgi:hypothetical protein